MARRYGLGSGLPEVAPHQDESQFRLFDPVYRAINALAKATSDAVGLTTLEVSDIQSAGPFIEFSGNLGRRMNFEAAETIQPARLIWLDGTAGESKMRHADATSGINRQAYGICVEPQAVPAGSRGRVVLFDGLLSGVLGVAPGTVYWLGAAGQFSPVMPGAPGWTQQKVGVGVTGNSIYVRINL